LVRKAPAIPRLCGSTNLSGMTGAAERVSVPLRIGREIITSCDDVVGSVADTRAQNERGPQLFAGASSQSGENTQFGPFPLCICGRFGRTLKRLSVGAIRQCELLHTTAGWERPWRTSRMSAQCFHSSGSKPQPSDARLVEGWGITRSRSVDRLYRLGKGYALDRAILPHARRNSRQTALSANSLQPTSFALHPSGDFSLERQRSPD